MAVSLRSLRSHLRKADIDFTEVIDEDTLVITLITDQDRNSYRQPDGSPKFRVLIQIHDDGRFLSISVPNAWRLGDSPHKAAVLEALLIMQSKFPVVRFDFHAEEGEIRANIEIPLADSRLTTEQLVRSIAALLQSLSTFDRVIYRAIANGVISFDDVEITDGWGDYDDDRLAKGDGSPSPRPAPEADRDEEQARLARRYQRLTRSTVGDRLRTVAAMAKLDGLEAVERLLCYTEEPPASPPSEADSSRPPGLSS